MNRVLILNRLRWFLRWPLKWAIFVLTLAVICFPYPHLVVRHIERWRDPNRLIEPDAPALRPLVEAVLAEIGTDMPPAEILKKVERFVYDRVPYDWDWNTWGNADYLPTVDEVMTKGKEDCDGRAVVAASLLRKLGFQSELVSDFTHVWVKTEVGELMGPGKAKAIIATDRGLKIDSRALAQVPKALGYGVAVFPWVREAVVVFVLWYLLLRSGNGFKAKIAGLCFLVNGLLFLRFGGKNHLNPVITIQVFGLVNLVFGIVSLMSRRPSDSVISNSREAL